MSQAVRGYGRAGCSRRPGLRTSARGGSAPGATVASRADAHAADDERRSRQSPGPQRAVAPSGEDHSRARRQGRARHRPGASRHRRADARAAYGRLARHPRPAWMGPRRPRRARRQLGRPLGAHDRRQAAGVMARCLERRRRRHRHRAHLELSVRLRRLGRRDHQAAGFRHPVAHRRRARAAVPSAPDRHHRPCCRGRVEPARLRGDADRRC